MLLAIQVVLISTVVYAIRRRKRVDPPWSWLRTVRAFCIATLIVAAVSLLPLVGRYAALVVWLISLKRMSGMDIPSTFIVAFLMGIAIFAISAMLSMQLQVDLLALSD